MNAMAAGDFWVPLDDNGVARYGSDGTFKRLDTLPGGDAANAIALDPDGQTYWVLGNVTGFPTPVNEPLYQIDKATGVTLGMLTFVDGAGPDEGLGASGTFWITATELPPPTPPDLTTIERPIRCERIAPHLWTGQNTHRLRYPGFELLVESGVPVEDDGQLTFTLQWSDDVGHTWSNPLTIKGSRIGQYRYRFRWLRLGQSRDRVFRVIDANNSKSTIIDAILSPDPVEGAN